MQTIIESKILIRHNTPLSFTEQGIIADYITIGAKAGIRKVQELYEAEDAADLPVAPDKHSE